MTGVTKIVFASGWLGVVWKCSLTGEARCVMLDHEGDRR